MVGIMKCQKCQLDITPDDQREHNDLILCEDCYMEALSPPRACDPWAVYTAKSFSDSDTGSPALSEAQQKILNLLKNDGESTVENLASKLQVTSADIEREIATLRHMEKVKGALVNGVKVIRLW